MKVSTLAFVTLASLVNAAAVPSEPWTTLTPTATIPSSASALTDFDGKFALSIKTISSVASGAAKRDDVVGQIGDGQPQQNTDVHQTAPKTTASVVNQIGDGQVQQQTTAKVVNQIGDGQVQEQTTAKVVNQIGDGQVQEQTTAKVVNQIGDGQVQQQTTAKVVNQIGDGQVQQQTASVVNQIGDGQVQAQPKTTASVANQIGDGQVQQQTKVTVSGQATQIGDGQVQATGGPSDAGTGKTGIAETCVADDALTLTLNGGVLHDAKGRIGAIVANRQFQFDGPPPQAGTIYAGGWSIVPASYVEDLTTQEAAEKGKRDHAEGYKLAIGKQTTFYKCLSGDFYNLYDQSIGGQCLAIEIEILRVVSC
jgi:hypothetical protein